MGSTCVVRPHTNKQKKPLFFKRNLFEETRNGHVRDYLRKRCGSPRVQCPTRVLCVLYDPKTTIRTPYRPYCYNSIIVSIILFIFFFYPEIVPFIFSIYLGCFIVRNKIQTKYYNKRE